MPSTRQWSSINGPAEVPTRLLTRSRSQIYQFHHVNEPNLRLHVSHGRTNPLRTSSAIAEECRENH